MEKGRLPPEAAIGRALGVAGEPGRQKKKRPGGSAQVLDKARFGQGESKLFLGLALAGLGWILLNLAQFGFIWIPLGCSSLHIDATDLSAPPAARRPRARRLRRFVEGRGDAWARQGGPRNSRQLRDFDDRTRPSVRTTLVRRGTALRRARAVSGCRGGLRD